MKQRRILSLLLVCALMAALFSGCAKKENADPSPPPDATTPDTIVQTVEPVTRVVDKDGTIVFGMNGSPNGQYNFYRATTTRLMITNDAIWDKLIFINGKGEIEPRAAESWEWSEDGKALTIRLRESWFHDGTPVTAADWVWTIKAVCNAELHDLDVTTKICPYLEGVDPDTGDELSEDSANVEYVDDHTFIIHLNDVYNKWSFSMSVLSYLTVFPKHYFTNPDGTMMDDVTVLYDGLDFWKAPVGSGPCKFVEDSLDSYTKLEAFDKYYGYGAEGPQFKYIMFQYISDQNQIGSKIIAGDLDVAYPGVSFEDAQFYAGNTQINMVESATVIQQIDINFDCSQVPKNVRLAMNYAIDKQFILDNLYGGRGIIGGASLVMPTYPYYTGEGTRRDIELARQYFQTALDNGSWSAERAVQLNVPEDTYEAAANIVKANCAEIGLKVDVVRRDSIPTIQQNMFWAPTEGYEAVLWSFAPTIDPAKVGMYLIKSLCVDQKFFARWGMREEDLEDVTNYTTAIQAWARAASSADE
ncbi:MAG: ABC transporter substrate-binding protein, partial [Oscillospiraceae bacterium]|nr:ABC transporter substrate-binding protein [Oscillospiraceae bacterium]